MRRLGLAETDAFALSLIEVLASGTGRPTRGKGSREHRLRRGGEHSTDGRLLMIGRDARLSY